MKDHLNFQFKGIIGGEKAVDAVFDGVHSKS